MKKILLPLFSLALSFTYTQVPAIQWAKSYGGSGDDEARAIRQTADGGYIVAGYTNSDNGNVTGHHFLFDFWVVKLNANGKIKWQKALGGDDTDFANDVIQTSDGGYIVAGATQSYNGDVTGLHGGDDFWIVKLDALGNIEWQKTLGGFGDDVAESIQQTNDGGYIVCGNSLSHDGDITFNHGGGDEWVVKLDATGNIQWQKTYGGTSNDFATSIKQTTDGGYIVSGGTASGDGDVTSNHGLDDYWVTKLDESGNLIWQKTLGGNQTDDAYSIVQANDGGFVVTGQATSNNGDVTGNHGWADFWTVKLNSSGTIIWQKSFGGTDYDLAYDITLTNDNGFLLAGLARSTDGNITDNHGNYDFWLVKISQSGKLKWNISLGGSEYDEAFAAQQTADGNFITAGFTYSTDGDVLSNHGSGDFWVVKLGGHAMDREVENQNGDGIQNISGFATIENNVLTVHYKSDNSASNSSTIQLLNLSGQSLMISDAEFVDGELNLSISIGYDIAPGIYLLQITSGENKITEKLMVTD